jgi:hypothetical protein
MAFTDYKNYATLKAKYPQIVINFGYFIPENLEKVVVSDFLREDLEFNLTTYRSNEYYAVETLISPVLRAAWKKYALQMNMWTHQAIKYDDDLSGVPDYMFTNLDQRQYEFMSYPIVTSVEAKAENFVEGWSQCIAQMIACQKLNEKENVTVFGIVTTGKSWEFGKLEGNNVTKHTRSYSIEYLQDLMNVLDYILAEAAKQLSN